jgi:F-type H+-transporting ATPase subunit epsilon
MSVHVEIVTPQARAFVGDADEVQAPGFLGEFGVLPGHSQFLSVVNPGVVTVHGSGSGGGVVKRFVVGRGFAEANPKGLIILTEVCEAAEDVDRAAAAKLLESAEATLASADPDSGEFANADRDAALARARLSL